MIKNIPIGRANVAGGITDPLQWSENLQLAINNGSQLTILDPKLPLIHQSITSSNYGDGSSSFTMLDPKKLFDISIILDSESIDSLNLRNLDNIIIESANENFSFGRITEPLITSHYWSPLSPTSKDCYLGVLFNTSELLILQRSNLRPSNYAVKINVFQELLSKLHLPEESFSGGEISMNYEQYLSLKVQSFRFNQITSNNEARLFLSLGLANNSISICELYTGLPVLLNINIGEAIFKHSWSPWYIKAEKYHSYLVVTTPTNSVILYELTFDLNSNSIDSSEPVCLQKSSRFLISQCDFHQVGNTMLLMITNTQKLKVFTIDTMKNIREANHDLSTSSLVTGTFDVTENESILDINIAFETGQFELVQFDLKTGKLQPKVPHNSLTKFVSKNLHKYQLYNSKQHDVEESENNATTPFLSNVVEGNFINYCTRLNSNGLVSIIYRIYPKNVLNYTILSKFEFNIGFIPIRELYSQVEGNKLSCTSLSYLNQLWFNKYNEIPKFPKLISDNNQDEINTFNESIQSFKANNFIDIKDVVIDISNIEDFRKYLMINFIENATIKNLQYLFNFNTIVLKSLGILTSRFPDLDNLSEVSRHIDHEQKQIEKIIIKHLCKLIISFVNQNNPQITSKLDQFIVINYYLIMSETDTKFESKFPIDAEIKLSTRFFEESFRVSINDIIEDDTTDMVTSTTNHKWSRCKLTFLPILELKNKVDELKMFNYIIYEHMPEESWMANTLMETLDFCIYSGNKKYEIS